MHHFTALGRPIDLRYASNRQAVGLTVLAAAIGAAAALGRQVPTAEIGSAALAAGVGAFLAWALGRELDPDAPVTAFMAGLASIATSLWLGSPALVLMVGVLFIGRVLLRPTGHPLRLLDLAGLLGLGVYLGSRPGGWGLAMVLAFSLARDRQLPGEPARFGRSVAALIAGGATAVAALTGQAGWTPPTPGAWTVLGIGLIAAASTPLRPSLSSLADITKKPLDPRRLASARRLTLVGLLAAALVGQPGIVGVAPGWVAMLSLALVHRGVVPGGQGSPR